MKIIVYDSMSSIRARMERGERQLLRGILMDANRVGVVPIFVWDAPGGVAKRRAIFPNYKNRPPSPQGTMANLELVRECLNYTNCIQARLPGFEADDIIAALVDRFPVSEIHTRDGDLAALGPPCIGVTAKIPAKLVRLYKLTVGDSSDTIPGVRGFGQKAWDAADMDCLRHIIDAVLFDQNWSDEKALGAGLSKSAINWLRENAALLRVMEQVIAPLPMSDAELDSAITKGTPNIKALEAILSRNLL